MKSIPKAVSEYMAEIGRRGGSKSTPAKTKAVRRNAKKGGRRSKQGR